LIRPSNTKNKLLLFVIIFNENLLSEIITVSPIMNKASVWTSDVLAQGQQKVFGIEFNLFMGHFIMMPCWTTHPITCDLVN
jgi:hypothetical protein